MDKLFINFKNCHGINNLKHEFIFNDDSFKNSNISLIYAPNGTMKTSFAKTFKDLGNNIAPQNILIDEEPKYTIKVTENNTSHEFEHEEIKNRIFVIESINDEFSFENTGPLISNKKSREIYEKISNNINLDKESFLDKIKSITAISIPRGENKYFYIENFINVDLNNDDCRFLEFMSKNINNLDDNEINIDVNLIKYKDLFDNSVIKLLNDQDLIENIDSFSKNLEILLSKSKIYNNVDFNHNNANDLSKSIKKNNLFKLGHSINFRGVRKNIRSIDELNKLIEKQLNIFNDESLKENFEKINRKFSNEKTKNFQKIINENPYLIPYLKDISKLKKIYWYSVFNSEKEKLLNLVNEFHEKRKVLENIRLDAINEKTIWHEIIDRFNKRFNVPYTLKLKNQDDVILNDEIPKIAYYYKDNDKEISLNQLKKIYSSGQRRALYLLDILYKIKMIKETDETKLLIFDDIADSFDYENKYAIIEYINELANDNQFRLIVLTHNFDFFRTLKSRLNCKYAYFATKTDYRIYLNPNNFESNNNIFINIIQRINENCENHIKEIIALIPFMRNLYEYSGEDYKKELLTNILHYKYDGESITLNSLNEIYNDWNVSIPDNSERIYNLIYYEADTILKDNVRGIDIINKLILSMAIRLKSEKIMINKLGSLFNEDDFSGNQTRLLFKKYKDSFPTDYESIDIYERVVMMTPENIHVNSFMYEPLLDMDDFYLKNLYQDISNVK